MRLLFGREFTLVEIKTIWDALFASPDIINMVEYMCVSMLLYLRDSCKTLLLFDLFIHFVFLFTELFSTLIKHVKMFQCCVVTLRSVYSC